MSGHTKGPWVVLREWIDDSCGGEVEIISVKTAPADDVDFFISGGGAGMELADANLIAAAPDLLEALIECLPCLGWQHESDEDIQREIELGNGYAEIILLARKAIALAKGVQQ